MACVHDFTAGDYVTHFIMGNGIVEDVKQYRGALCVVVYFEDKRTRGAYDANWFLQHPDRLQKEHAS